LDDHEAVSSPQTETGVLSDDVTFGVLGDDLVSISRRCSKDVEHDVLDGVSQLAELIGRTAFLNIDPDKRHGQFSLC
jgi:hypothetical protein